MTLLPLFGICDIARHHLRPVVVAVTTGEGGREEFDILMVCSRCGYTRSARQLLQASEQLALEVLEEIAQQSEDEAPEDTAAEELGAASAEDTEKAKNPRSRPLPRKKLN
jgi:hypothetical protein